MPQDKQLHGIRLDDVLEKRRLDQALNAKEFAVLAAVGYSTTREWFRPPGFPRGSDLLEFAAKPPTMGAEWIKYFLLQDPKCDWNTITAESYELLFKQSDDRYASLFGAPDPDLSGLRDHKGTLIMVQGMADHMVPPEGPIRYYENVVKRMGGLEQVQPFARLFQIPGVAHVMQDSVGLLDSLILWVEKGQAPEHITWKTKVPGGKTAERPVFPYPLKAVYQPGKNSGDAPTWVSNGRRQ